MPIIQKVNPLSGCSVYTIFGSFSLHLWCSFQLSLTLLVHYRCIRIFSLRVLVPRSSNLFMLYSRSSTCFCLFETYGARLPSLAVSWSSFLVFWLLMVRSPLLHESLLISFPSATKMFQFAEFLFFLGFPPLVSPPSASLWRIFRCSFDLFLMP